MHHAPFVQWSDAACLARRLYDLTTNVLLHSTIFPAMIYRILLTAYYFPSVFFTAR